MLNKQVSLSPAWWYGPAWTLGHLMHHLPHWIAHITPDSCCPGDQTLGFVHIRQELYQLSCIPAPTTCSFALQTICQAKAKKANRTKERKIRSEKVDHGVDWGFSVLRSWDRSNGASHLRKQEWWSRLIGCVNLTVSLGGQICDPPSLWTYQWGQIWMRHPLH